MKIKATEFFLGPSGPYWGGSGGGGGGGARRVMS